MLVGAQQQSAAAAPRLLLAMLPVLLLPLLNLAACSGAVSPGPAQLPQSRPISRSNSWTWGSRAMRGTTPPASSAPRSAAAGHAANESLAAADRASWVSWWSHPAHSTTSKPSAPPADSILGYDIPCGVRNVGSSDRIVGGVDAVPGEFPWQVSLQKKRLWDMQHICGGAVVSPFWVVTAGHCVDGLDLKDLSVVTGDHDLYKVEGKEQRRKVVRVVGLGYDKNTFANDISLLQLDRKLRFHPKHTAPICVPRPGHHYSGSAVVSGWGRLSESGGLPNVLQQVSLPIIPWNKCKQQYKSRGFMRFLHTCQICSGKEAGGQDSCQGDSGGPLACQEEDGRYYLCGVVSWGIGCARAQYPGVYTETSCYARWINEVLYNEHHYLDPETRDEEA